MTNHERAITNLKVLITRANCQYGPVTNIYETMGAIEQEMLEVREAIQARNTVEIRDELFDVANVAIRGAIALMEGEDNE